MQKNKKTIFGVYLKELFLIYEIDYTDFAEQYSWSTSTIRYWIIGRNLPCYTALKDLEDFFQRVSSNNKEKKENVMQVVHNLMESGEKEKDFFALELQYPRIEDYIQKTLSIFYNWSKGRSFENQLLSEALPSGKIHAIVFDFDGTLTLDGKKETTWELIWLALGYKKKTCQELHQKYDRNEITHRQWCELTQQFFCEKHLHRDLLIRIAKRIEPIPGIEETFLELQNRDIKIYIVSGSISIIIRQVLGNLVSYIEEIKSNIFRFDENGYLSSIVGTNYDFEGKADYIRKVAYELNISPRDIIFVGNSINDRFAYTSGAKTLCINPIITDTTNQEVWNDCIQSCDSLTEILDYI